MTRTSTSGTTGPPVLLGWTPVGGELLGDGLLEPRVEHEQHLVTGLDDGVGLGHEALATAQHRDDQAALGQLDVRDRAARGGSAVAHLDLDDLKLLGRQVEQVHEPVGRHLVLDEAQDQVGGRDRGLDAQQLEPLQVARVVDAGDDALAEVLLARDLADQQVVLVVAGDGDDQVGALDPGALEDPQLGGVAVLDRVLELLLDRQVATTVVLDQRDLVALADQLAGEVPADLAASGDDDVHQTSKTSLNSAIAACVGQIVWRPCSAYQVARAGSMIRAITCSTLNLRLAIWAITRFVLSPSVEAMKTSASAIPASESASISIAWPTVKRPPASSHDVDWPSSSRS